MKLWLPAGDTNLISPRAAAGSGPGAGPAPVNVVPSACNPDGAPNVEGMQKDLSFVQSLGLVDRPVTVDSVLDLSFLKAALADLGPYKRG